jgi:hypothetical protein
MADSSVAVTAGAGTSIDTRTEATGGQHRQVVVLGDPSTNAGVAPIDATSGVKVNLGSDNDVSLNTGTNTIGEITIGAATTAAGDLAKAEDVAHASGDVGVMALAVENEDQADLSTGDKDYTPIAVTKEGNIIVKQEGTITVTESSPISGFATSTKQLADGHNVTIDNASIAVTNAIGDGWDNTASDGASVSGDVAHSGIDAGEPVKVGFKAIDIDTDPIEVAEDDRTDWYSTRLGVPWVLGGHPNMLNASINVTDGDGAQTNAAIITVATNVAIVVTHIAVTADNANTVDVQCRVGFGTTTTPAEDAAKQVLNHPGIAPGSGVIIGSGAGIIGQGVSNEDLRVTCADPVSGSITINVTYFTIAI